MKKTKLFSSIMALALVLSVGACTEVSEETTSEDTGVVETTETETTTENTSEDETTSESTSEGNTSEESSDNTSSEGTGEIPPSSGSSESESLTLDEVLARNNITDKLLHDGESVTIENCVVIGIHGNTLTVQQSISNSGYWWDVSVYSIEVVVSTMPEDIDVFYGVTVSGTVTTTSYRRVILSDASITVTSNYAYHYLVDGYYFIWDGYTYYFYSGALTEFYFKFIEEEPQEYLTYFSWMYGIDDPIYRMFYVEVYGDEYLTNYVTDSFIIIYDDVGEDVKKFYDAFFDGTEESVTLNYNTIEAGWGGLSYGDTFFCDAKIQLCTYSFFFNFDCLETWYISAYEIPMTLYNVLLGAFDNQEVTIEGVLMDKHGKTLTIQSTDNWYSDPYSIEVELAESEATNELNVCTYVSVSGIVSCNYSWWDYAELLNEPVRTLENASVTTIDPTDQSFGYWANSQFYYSYADPMYNAASMDLVFQVIYLPESWNKDGSDDLVVWCYIYSEVSWGTYYFIRPVLVYGDADQTVKDFWYAFFYGCEQATSISYPLTNQDGSKIEPDYTLPAGHPGCPVNSTFETHFAQNVTDYVTQVPDDNGNLYDGQTGAISLTQLAGVYMSYYVSSAEAMG